MTHLITQPAGQSELGLSSHQVLSIENLARLTDRSPRIEQIVKHAPAYVVWDSEHKSESITVVVDYDGKFEVSDSVEDDVVIPDPVLPEMDYGTIQRLRLAERLQGANLRPGAPSLFDESTLIQQFWLRVADEAVAALMEERSA